MTLRANFVFFALRCSALAAAALLAGCSVSAPGAVETSFMNGVKRNLTVGGKKEHDPVPATAENVAEGRKIFQNYCTSCHGETGQNEGVLFAERVSPPIPRLDSTQVQEYTDGQLKWVIANGVSPSGMPAWKGVLDEAEMWKIVLYIRSLSPAKVP